MILRLGLSVEQLFFKLCDTLEAGLKLLLLHAELVPLVLGLLVWNTAFGTGFKQICRDTVLHYKIGQEFSA